MSDKFLPARTLLCISVIVNTLHKDDKKDDDDDYDDDDDDDNNNNNNNTQN
jgi:hypothetical protein